jgi:hypothetical protein
MVRDACRQCGAVSGEGDQGVTRENAPSGEVYWLCQNHYVQEMDRQRHLTPHLANNTTDLVRAMWKRVTGWTQMKHLPMR